MQEINLMGYKKNGFIFESSPYALLQKYMNILKDPHASSH